MPNIYADENYPYAVVLRLRALGHDVLTAREDGRANQKIGDADVLARAIQLGRAVISENRRDFHRLHLLDPNHAGIITNTYDPDYDALTARIHAALTAVPSLDGLLIRIVRPGRGRKP